LQSLHPVFPLGQEIFPVSEGNGPERARGRAGGFVPLPHPIGAESTLVGLSGPGERILNFQHGNLERTELGAVAAAVAPILVEHHVSIVVMIQGARGAHIHAGRLGAMVAGTLYEQLSHLGKFAFFMNLHLGVEDIFPHRNFILLLAFHRTSIAEKAHGSIDEHRFSHIFLLG
jgi:hypothetical protein